MQLISLKAFVASTSESPHLFVEKLAFQISWTLWTAPSIPTFNLAQICSSWHVLGALGSVTFRTHFVESCIQVSSIPTRCTPVCLSRDINRPDINTRQDSQVWLWLSIQLTKISTLVRKQLLSSLNFKSHPCRASKYVYPGPKLPESFCATDPTTSSVIFILIHIYGSPYTSNVEHGGGGGPGRVFSSVTSILSDASLLGCRTTPNSCSQTNLIYSRNFLHITRFDNVQWHCFAFWFPRALRRYIIAAA